MLGSGVLCLKKRKKKTYSLSKAKEKKKKKASKNDRSNGGGGDGSGSGGGGGGGGTVTMLQITEDTPPDMLAGAMDLTVHLPTGRAVKMAVERSTPMMDLLVQITTNHHLQLSNHTLQALGMAPSSDHSDKILPYKPNTPIGTLDTQHIKVVPKSRGVPVPKNIPPGHQPFESTFRLKVHLPRNQLYVTRVSRNVMLEDIVRKVCEEKNLDPGKYELKHPGNLDEVLDPKLTLSDYQITEVYVVLKGAVTLNQAFSSNDIMALRKEEERKQMHNKTGGGVFNLIFRRGKSSMGSGSISSETRSISPTHSDDSRSVTPPAMPQQILAPAKKEPPPERPKPPQRKRRPAPKPPQSTGEDSRRNSEEKPTSVVSEVSELRESRKVENGLTICHSRNSSDSSGYHEASVLSDNCNTSLPRRPKSAFVGSGDFEKVSRMHSQSTTNLTKMSYHSKSTTSLGIAGRKKKAAAPPPPPTIRASNPAINVETPSPVVASQSASVPQESHSTTDNCTVAPPSNIVPLPRSKVKAAPVPMLRRRSGKTPSHEHHNPVSENLEETDVAEEETDVAEASNYEISHRIKSTKINNSNVVEEIIKENILGSSKKESEGEIATRLKSETEKEEKLDDLGDHLETEVTEAKSAINEGVEETNKTVKGKLEEPEQKGILTAVAELQKKTHKQIFSSPDFLGNKPPEIVAVIPKMTSEETGSPTGNKRFQVTSTLTESFDAETASIRSRQSTDSYPEETSPNRNSGSSAGNFGDDLSDLDDKVFSGSLRKKTATRGTVFNQLFGMHNLENEKVERAESVTSLQSIPEFMNKGGGLKKWSNLEDLDDLSLASLGPNSSWAYGDQSETESFSSQQALDSLASLTSGSSNIAEVKKEHKFFGSTDSGIAQEIAEKLSETEEIRTLTPPPPPILEDSLNELETIINNETEPAHASPVQDTKEVPVSKCSADAQSNGSVVGSKKPDKRLTGLVDRIPDVKESDAEIDWQYQLPSPPKAFRDSSPVPFVDQVNSETQSVDCKDSVVTSPELFEKLKTIEDNQSENGTITSELSTVSEEEKPLCNNLSLENLERRKSLVYNRELATSFKMTDNDIMHRNENIETFSSSLMTFESTYSDVQKSSPIKEVIEPKYVQKPVTTNTLPNFKISTYDKPNQKFKVFEDDTIHSNTLHTKITSGTANVTAAPTTLKKPYIGSSMENISFRKSSFDDQYKSVHEPVPKGFKPVTNVFRSESFSTESHWSPSRPVSRSKSQLALNKYREEKMNSKNESMSRSNSLYDVSGLQSLGVMRLIQNRLNTPTSSTENLGQDRFQKAPSKPLPKIETPKTELSLPKKETQLPPRPPPVEETPKLPEKIYKYRGPPSVNMGTWSDRPKVPVSVKEDADYKLSNNISSKLIVNTTNNHITSNNTIEVKNSSSNNSRAVGFGQTDAHSVSIKVNGVETGSSKTHGNVIIKIGPEKNRAIENQRFISHTTAVGYRKPFTDLNRNQSSARPHSIAFSPNFDISRVPVVRSVELKKPFRDMGNTSVTQISQDDKSFTPGRTEPVLELKNKFSNLHKSTETLTSKTYLNNDEKSKPVVRVNSLKPAAPTVRGFKTGNEANTINRYSWNPLNYSSTLPAKPWSNEKYQINNQVPFSQLNLRRIESNRIEEKPARNDKDTEVKPASAKNSYSSLPSITKPDIKPPPPPLMPRVSSIKPSKVPESTLDQRDQLLSAIRNFGGKKGLKVVKV